MDNIENLEAEITALEESLREKKAYLSKLKKNIENNVKCCYCPHLLSTDEIVRYSRQMIMPEIGVLGQVKFKNSKVLIVGAGGLGCPAALYLAAAGIGEIYIADYDDVELTNFHRQILHYEPDLNKSKVQSLSEKLELINSNISIVPKHIHVDGSIYEDIAKNKYDVVLDCTDNAPSRYLLNDVCVLNQIPLVSGSALQMEGQLTVYNYKNGPCYRCLHPKPPPPHLVTNCGDGGVLGPVAGVIGVLQALETVKILLGNDGVLSGRMLVFEGAQSIIRNLKLRQKIKECYVCGSNPKIVAAIDYEKFCGSKLNDKVIDINLLKGRDNIDVFKLKELLINKKNVVLDVRPNLEFEMCKLPNTFNIPYTQIASGNYKNVLSDIFLEKGDVEYVYVLCRRGNDSQRAINYLREHYKGSEIFVNVKGGLHAYSKLIDNSFPVY